MTSETAKVALLPSLISANRRDEFTLNTAWVRLMACGLFAGSKWQSPLVIGYVIRASANVPSALKHPA